MFRCCQTTVKRAVRNHMGDDVEIDDALIRNAELPGDVAVMLGLKECDDDDKAPPANTTNRWRPWARRTPGAQALPRLLTQSSPKVSVEAAGSNSSNRHPVVLSAKSEASSTMPTWEKPAGGNLTSVEGFLASIQLGDGHAQMLLDEGIKTRQDLLHIKEILGTESLRLVKESLKARGFTTFELIKFISAVKGMPA
ncbi:hypothetical protein EI94DRAFT_1811604 [Lactarius quietus]|nr:hypothetical protein EI94DRAFT_1811604 [Lactarius quietus]